MSNNTPIILWNKPEGELFCFQAKSEVVYLLNKFNIDENQLINLGISFKDTISQNESENNIVFEDDSSHSSYCDTYTLPIFDYNEYEHIDKQSANFEHTFVNNYILEDLIFDTRWKFPCQSYINISSTFDRLGGREIFIWTVIPIGKEHNIMNLIRKENEMKDTWINNFIKHLRIEELIDKMKLGK